MNVMKKNPVTGTHFVPSFFMDPASFHNVTAMDGAFSVSPSLRIEDFSQVNLLSMYSGTLLGHWETLLLLSITIDSTYRISLVEHTWRVYHRGSLP